MSTSRLLDPTSSFELSDPFQCIRKIRIFDGGRSPKMYLAGGLPRYGPNYAGTEAEFFKDIKDKSLIRVIGTDVEVKAAFIDAIKSVDTEAKASYADYHARLFNEFLAEHDFEQMMLKDGCFFLQMVLRLFDIPLKYPLECPFLGSIPDKKTLNKWILPMFSVGNQIPLVVLDKLMGQSFFQEAIQKITQLKQPIGIMEQVLYEFLLAPALSNNQLPGPRPPTPLQKPCDLLHALHSMMAGSGVDENGKELCIIIPGHNADDAEIFRSAKELIKAGVRFNGVDGMGIKEIHYKHNNIFKDVLSLPCVFIDDNTELLFKSLKDYEVAQKFKIHEVGSYLKFLSELVPTIEDAEILASKGVIKGQIKEFPGLLHMLACRGKNLTRKLYDVQLEIDHYSRPRSPTLKQFAKYCGNAAVIFGAPTVVGALQYFKKTNGKDNE